MRSFSRSGCARLSRSVWSLSSGKRSVDFSLWERRANENADDAVAQQVFAEKLLEAKEFRKLRVRVESGLFAVNTATYLAYLQAMAALGAVDNVPPSVASRVIEHQSRSQLQPEPQKPFSVTSPIPVVLSGENELLVRMKPNRLQQLGSFMLSLAILYFLFKAFGGSRNEAGGIMGMLRGTHQLAMDVDVTFADVIGLDEAKHEVEVLVDYLHEPEKLGGLYLNFGVKMPKGLLMFGPPGVGKTLLARAMAGEAGVPFFYLSASQVEEVFVGMGAARIRSLFQDARKAAPSIIFIDEIDAIGGKRDFSGVSGGSSMRQSLTQMLTLMDGFEEDLGVLVIAATNASEDDLDSALLRSGRFDKKVFLQAPFRADRKRLFEFYLNKLPRPPSARDAEEAAEQLAGLSWGMSGADIANVCNQAGILAVRRGASFVTMSDLAAAHADVVLGPENKSLRGSDAEKRATAVHEAGHTIVSVFTPAATPPRQVTVVPRKNALGYMSKDVKDRVSESKEEYLAEIAVAMGGRAAEEAIYGPDRVTSGAESDFRFATNVAEAMVSSFGFSSLGPVNMKAREKGSVSEQTKGQVDEKIAKILEERYTYALNLIKSKASEHRNLVEILMKKETLTQDEIYQTLGLSKR